MHYKGYKFFYRGFYNLNIIGIRSKNSESDKFDDEIHVIYKNGQGEKKHDIFPCTTDPGKYWLLNPMRKKGTIIMVPGQYSKAYKVGFHKSYKALEQINPMTYVRDNSKDSKLDFSLYSEVEEIEDVEKIKALYNPAFETSNSKTNIHRASKWKNLLNVGRYSAGCQVIQNPLHFDKLIDLCEEQENWGQGETFTYTLLEEKDFDDE